MIGTLAQMIAAVQSTVPPETSPETLILAVGGIAGAFGRVLWVKHQHPLTKEAAFDYAIGALIGLLWRAVGIELFGVIPDFLPTWGYLVRAAIVAAFAFASLEILKRVLMKTAPDFLEQRLGVVLPKSSPPAAEPK